jgi:hypothetical protein
MIPKITDRVKIAEDQSTGTVVDVCEDNVEEPIVYVNVKSDNGKEDWYSLKEIEVLES